MCVRARVYKLEKKNDWEYTFVGCQSTRQFFFLVIETNARSESLSSLIKKEDVDWLSIFAFVWRR